MGTITSAEYRIAAAAMAQFDAAMADYAAAWDGWAQQGAMPEVCRHGFNQWVDHGRTCRRCEQDLTVREERYAVGRAAIARHRGAAEARKIGA